MTRVFFRARRLTLLALALLSTVALGVDSRSPAQESVVPAATVEWRRTANGWERADLWTIDNLAVDVSAEPSAPAPPPNVHPILLAALILAAAGLLAIPAHNSR